MGRHDELGWDLGLRLVVNGGRIWVGAWAGELGR